MVIGSHYWGRADNWTDRGCVQQGCLVIVGDGKPGQDQKREGPAAP
jgi:hypothetical protein